MSLISLRQVTVGRLFMTIMLVLGLTAFTAQNTASQEVETPPPWDCFVEPVGLLSLLEIMNRLDEVSGAAVLEPIDAGFITAGEPLRPEDQSGIEQTTWELAACVNGRDPFRVAALFTPNFQAGIVVGLLSGEGLPDLAEQIPVIAGQVDPDQELSAIPITAAWYSEFSSHEIEAVLSPFVEGLDEQREFLVRFVYSDGRWLIDEMRLIEEARSAVPVATPIEESNETQSSPVAETLVTVVSRDIFFEPIVLTIPADTAVIVILPNEGAAPHNFAIDELDIDVDIAPGDGEEVVINAPAGEYEFYCNIPGHREAGMVGTLNVE